MDARAKLLAVKVVHTAVWLVMAGATGVILHHAWAGLFDTGFFVAVGLIAAEVVVLVANGWTCPLTPVAARYTHSREPNFDIYLPRWLARHNTRIFTTIFTTIFIVGAIAVIARHLIR